MRLFPYHPYTNRILGISLYTTNQVIHKQIMLFSNIHLDFSSEGFKVWMKFATTFLFCRCMSFVFPVNLSLISGVIHGTELTERLLFDGMCVSTESLINDVIRLKFSCTKQESE